MNAKQTVIHEDMERITQSIRIPWDKLKGKHVFVTGATGLIGSTLVKALLCRSENNGTDISVSILARNPDRARELFAQEPSAPEIIAGSLEKMPAIDAPVDYIIHCACPTDSNFFLHHPVDTIDAIMTGTRNILELAKEKRSAGVVYLSSMEVYGKVEQEVLLREDMLGEIDLMSPRSSYPMAKRMAENLCCSYAAQYGVPVTICRLAQTFGPGVNAEDKRVFAYMSRCAHGGRDIELATSGSKKNMYLYTADAVTAILTVLLRGQSGTAYNAANPRTYCSVKEMAQMVADTFGNGSICVKTNVGADGSSMFPPDSYLMLDTSNLYELDWRPSVNLQEMYRRMIAAF